MASEGTASGSEPRRADPRALAAGALALAVVVLLVLLTRGEDPYRLHLRLTNASQLVKGNLVEVGGLQVGTVTAIELADDNEADVTLEIDDEDFAPLHTGTRAIVRSASVSGVANRYVALEPGPNNAEPMASGDTIPSSASTSSTDLDAVLSTLDADTRQRLQATIQGSDSALQQGGAKGMNASLRYLDPALSQIQGTLGELIADRGALQQFIVASSGVVSAVAARRDDLAGGLSSAATTAGALAADRRALADVLARAPTALGGAGRTLDRLAGTLDELKPTVDLAAPVAPRLSRTLTAAAPALRQTADVLPAVRALLPTLRGALAGLPALRSTAVPAIGAATDALKATAPIVSAARAAFPDIALGATNGFGGTSGGSYDANGEYARIAFVSTSTPVVGILGNLVPSFPGSPVKFGNVARCPGGAGVAAADGSNVFDPGYACEPGNRP
ncbi:hypothetical protein DSM112329_05354 [Paraconexibacter sp. AEG42_29]|uniref:Mce/MlaD domain-containing protein n=1 Tax=Paraconexibacter sp. AEG42_29 TaxID=2997339 RepID=A0AAU7B490_9ACTN